MLTAALLPGHAYSVTGHPVIGIGVPSEAAKSRMQCGFFCVWRALFMGGPGGEPQGSPVPHRYANPFGSAHPIGVGERFVQRTEAHIMTRTPTRPRAPVVSLAERRQHHQTEQTDSLEFQLRVLETMLDTYFRVLYSQIDLIRNHPEAKP